MSKTFKVASLIAFLTCLFSSLDVNASLKNQFKQEQKGKGDCNLQTSKWYGTRFNRLNDSRFCISGGMYRFYDKLLPKGKIGGKLNVKTKRWDSSLRDYVIKEIGIDDDKLIVYECEGYSNSWDCRGPVRQDIFAMRDYLALYLDAQVKEDSWRRSDEDYNDRSLLSAAINRYAESIVINPADTKYRKKMKAFAYVYRGKLLEHRAFMDTGDTDYANPKMKGNKDLKQAIQNITNAMELVKDNDIEIWANPGGGLGTRARYKLGFYTDKKYACEDIKKAADLGESTAKDNYKKFCFDIK